MTLARKVSCSDPQIRLVVREHVDEALRNRTRAPNATLESASSRRVVHWEGAEVTKAACTEQRYEVEA